MYTIVPTSGPTERRGPIWIQMIVFLKDFFLKKLILIKKKLADDKKIIKKFPSMQKMCMLLNRFIILVDTRSHS